MFIPGFQDIISARLRAIDCAGIPRLGGETTHTLSLGILNGILNGIPSGYVKIAIENGDL